MTSDEMKEEKRMGGRADAHEMRKECYARHADRIDIRMCAVNKEFRQGFDLIRRYPTSVTIFGSARFKEDHPYYQLARETARRIAKETGYAIITGGGPGIMEAGNRGAKDANGVSIGITIDLPFEQETNPYVDQEASFYYFFSRKVVMSYSSEAYIYFPGGFGTLDEFFEILTLVQTKKAERLPIILMGSDFWKPLDGFIRSLLSEQYGTISEGDECLYTITDDIDQVVKMVQDAPINRQQ